MGGLIQGWPALDNSTIENSEVSIELHSLLPAHCSTPVNISELERELASHPDRIFVNSLLHDLTYGFNIGYKGPRLPHLVKNLLSVCNNSEVVHDYLQKQILLNRVAGPFKHPPLVNLQCSPIGLVPKKDGSWRMIMDLSAPKGSSVNDYIPQEESSVQYSKFDDSVDTIANQGPGALMAKLDIKLAFRLCPVRPEDWELLGIH